MKTTIVTVGALAATAAIGGVAADPGSDWYRSLRKPRWQPPPPAYALVWTPLYVTIAYAGARALTRAQSRDRSQLAAGLILDLALNAAWTPLFFRARRPRAALAEIHPPAGGGDHRRHRRRADKRSAAQAEYLRLSSRLRRCRRRSGSDSSARGDRRRADGGWRKLGSPVRVLLPAIYRSTWRRLSRSLPCRPPTRRGVLYSGGRCRAEVPADVASERHRCRWLIRLTVRVPAGDTRACWPTGVSAGKGRRSAVSAHFAGTGASLMR